MPSNREWVQFFSSGTIPRDLQEPLAVLVTFLLLSALLYLLLRPSSNNNITQHTPRVPIEVEPIGTTLLPTQMQGLAPEVPHGARDCCLLHLTSADAKAIELCIGADDSTGITLVQELAQADIDRECKITLIVQVNGEQSVE
jgi:hypothetical protein